MRFEGVLMNVFVLFIRTWPMNSADALKDFLGARLESDLH